MFKVHRRNDLYNKKIKKYHVIYGEENDELSENEEREEHQDHEARLVGSL